MVGIGRHVYREVRGQGRAAHRPAACAAGQGYMDERCPAREYNHDDFGRHVPDLGQAAVTRESGDD